MIIIRACDILVDARFVILDLFVCHPELACHPELVSGSLLHIRSLFGGMPKRVIGMTDFVILDLHTILDLFVILNLFQDPSCINTTFHVGCRNKFGMTKRIRF